MLPAAHYGLMLLEASHWLQHYNRSRAFSWSPHTQAAGMYLICKLWKTVAELWVWSLFFFSFFFLFLLLEQLLLLALISPWWETNRLASGLTLTFKRALALLSVSQLMSSIHAAAICNSARSISRLRCGEEEQHRDGDMAAVHNENTASLSEHTHAEFFFYYSYQVGFSVPPFFVICSPNTSKIVSLPQMK